MSVLAGLARMHFGRFLAALLLGTVPVAVLFAWIGHASTERPALGMVLVILIPLAFWPLVAGAVKTDRRGAETQDRSRDPDEADPSD
jgi:uncharacterized membrane protein YdjX (TVP38/TMEM64 family)